MVNPKVNLVPNTIQCPACQGEGKIPIGEILVTREMAIDAGDKALEGTVYETYYVTCTECNGSGLLPNEQLEK